MVKLCLNYIDGLETLDRENELDFQFVWVGNWFDRATISKIVARFPDKSFLYHHNCNIRATEAKTQALITTLQERQRQTGSPWLSAHLDQHTDQEIRDLLEDGRRPPHYDAERAFQLICDAFHALQSHLAVPLLLENVPHWPLPEPDVAVTPNFIRRVLDETKCGLVLDTAHAQITAHRLNCDVRSYLREFPLERIVEIHTAGPRYQNGRLLDVHETLRDQDFALLEWLLNKTAPKVITFEYAKELDELPAQALRLNQLILAQRFDPST